ncbi:MAG: hypothetical protein GY831_26450, partial [Delftia sp.]|nr:hypothetical protein [Delftia sp.]
YQGTLVHSRRTRAITEAVAIALFTTGAILVAGVVWGQAMGLYVGLAALWIGLLAQTVWLRHRSRPVMRALKTRDEALFAARANLGRE